jgi:hypothetical protein
MLMLMLVLGVGLVIGVPYLALKTLPQVENPVTGEVAAPTGNPNLGIDFDELNNLPPDLSAGAAVILSQQEEAMLPEPLMDLPEASGIGPVYPVTETIESTQPTLSWNLFERPPFKVLVKDKGNKVVAQAQNLFNTSWVMQGKLNPGETYMWEVTASNGETQSAAFIVLTTEQVAEWQRIRAQFGQSPLALGLAAEQFGMLTVAEREYQELARQFPRAEAPARLLANVLSLRE